MKKSYFLWPLTIATVLIVACSGETVTTPTTPDTSNPPVAVPIGKGNCELISETIKLANQTVKMPAKGRMPLESHLVSKSDAFASGVWPKSQTEKTAEHITKSCAIYKSRVPEANCKLIYNTEPRAPWSERWTPSEGGAIGQGSVGNLRPSLEQEVWSGNMNWTGSSKPKIGVNDKFLASFNGKHVVVNTGFETGPGSTALLGGLQVEPLYYLGAGNSSQIALGRLKDQSLPLGPIKCEE